MRYLMKWWICCVCLAACWLGPGAGPAWAQQEGVLQIDDPIHRFLLRQQAAGHLPDAFLSHRPLSAYEARRYLDTLAAADVSLGRVDRQLLARFRSEGADPHAAWLRRRLPFTYRNGYDLFAFEGDGYAVEVNPQLYIEYGRARQTAREGREAVVPAWQWARGARVAGHLGNHLFFETRLTENYVRMVWPRYKDGSLPRQGFANIEDRPTRKYGYFTATGLIGLRTRFVEVRFGRDRNRWGAGTGSLVLSDYASPYDFLQIRTTVGPFQYTNLFAGLSEPSLRRRGGDTVVPRKYAALHRLAVQLPARIEFAVFEAVMFGTDSLGARKGFDLSYLNPVLFYRAVERDRGSPDNVLLGAGLSWVALPGLQLYSEFMLDELKVDRIGKGWWGNKWGWLAGAHLVDLPVPNLSVRAEFARLRPYLYSHRSALTNYVHHYDVLGHPAGPNARDYALFVDYRPALHWRGGFNVAYTQRGRNTAQLNYGSDPLETYNTRVQDHDVRLLQGVRQHTILLEGSLGYELLPALWLEGALRFESVDDAEEGVDRYLSPFLLLRWGLPFSSLRY